LIKKYKKFFKLGGEWFHKNGFLTVLVFAALPLPDDIIGLIAGSLKYNKTKYFMACLIGKIILTTVIVISASYSFEMILNYVG